MTLSFAVTARDGAARTGVMRTARGDVQTPCFMPVGTRGAVRHLSSADLEDLGAQVVLANTYHLMLKPGVEVIAHQGGLHRFQDWPGHLLTDSGGFQIFSLESGGNVKVDDDGVTFRSTYDGSSHRLTPESAVTIQTSFGSDIQMVLDVCAPLPSSEAVLRQALERTTHWATRARGAFLAQGRPELSQFGIVQGGTDINLRVESAERTVAISFDGYAVGGLSVGESRSEMLRTLTAVLPTLPEDQPRYLMGLGDPIGIVEAVALGIDLFDCVLPTRFARHGTILSGAGRYNLKRAENASADAPLDATCGCPVCARWSRSYLRHLLVVDEPTAPRLLTIHNLWWTMQLVQELRAAIATGTLGAVRSRISAAYG
ncbi:MAG: tRNA guanosine(34) transglycosylase Tgt [Acidimicrobiia bacterium]|nr:tRNA guanosine(34) transglycosylase Tgt [Acidimicrobiia bacterium]